MDNLSQLGVGGALAVMVLALVFSFLKSRKRNDPVLRCPLEDRIQLWESRLGTNIADSMTKSLDQLWEARVPKAIADSLNQSLRSILENQTNMIGQIAHEQAETRRDIARMEGRIRNQDSV